MDIRGPEVQFTLEEAHWASQALFVFHHGLTQKIVDAHLSFAQTHCPEAAPEPIVVPDMSGLGQIADKTVQAKRAVAATNALEWVHNLYEVTQPHAVMVDGEETHAITVELTPQEKRIILDSAEVDYEDVPALLDARPSALQRRGKQYAKLLPSIIVALSMDLNPPEL